MTKITCTKCQQQKPATLEFFAARAAKANGFTSWCRECSRHHAKPRPRNWKKKPETLMREQLTAQGLQKCTHCKVTKVLDDFGPEPRMYSGRSSWCLACVRERARKKQAERRRDPSKRKKLLEEKKRYAKSARGIQQKRISSEVHNHRRRQRMFAVAWNWTVEKWSKCKQAWQYKCAYCDKTGTLTQDHFIPISHPACPGTVPTNMLPACVTCNCSKGSIHPHDWITDAKVLRKIEKYFEKLGTAE